MIFDADNLHRRKSSLNHADGPKPSARPQVVKRNETTCFVHDLLDKERKSRQSNRSEEVESLWDHAERDKAPDDHDRSTRSRLLTKKQLSDMARGVRELSKKLGSIRLKLKVKTVFILTKAHDEDLIGYTRGVAEWLLSKERDTPYTVYAGVKDLSLIPDANRAAAMLKTPSSTTTDSTPRAFWPRIHLTTPD